MKIFKNLFYFGKFYKKDEIPKTISKISNKELECKINIIKLIKIYNKYKNKYKRIKINKPDNNLKIGIVGELYSIMEPYSSCNIERKLASMGIEVHRFTTLTYLLLIKKFKY